MESRTFFLTSSGRLCSFLFFFLVLFSLLGFSGCFDFVTTKPVNVDIPKEKQMSFASKENLAAGATVNLEKAAKVFYEGTEPQSESGEFIFQWAIRMVGILGVNTSFDPDDPEQLKSVLEGGTKALEEKNAIIHDLKEQVSKAQEQVLEEKAGRTKAEERSAGLWGWVKTLIWIAILLFIAEVLTGIPFFSGATKIIKKLSKQTVNGIQEFRENLKEKASNGDPDAAKTLDELDSILDKHQDDSVKEHVKKLKAGG